jgi:phosphoadenosine phosphosulfate reductase
MTTDTKLDLEAINAELANKSARQIIAWALEQKRRTIVTTSFGPGSAALLHMVSLQDSELPVVWVDSGYNMRDTYLVAEQLIEKLDLNARVYVPSITAERLNVIMGGIPTLEEPEKHAEFTRIVKLEPFDRAISELDPEIWINGIRRSDTDFRKSLDVVSWDQRGILKVAPIFNWSDDDLEAYMLENQLPSARHYFDPTKVESGRECGLHTAA